MGICHDDRSEFQIESTEVKAFHPVSSTTMGQFQNLDDLEFLSKKSMDKSKVIVRIQAWTRGILYRKKHGRVKLNEKGLITQFEITARDILASKVEKVRKLEEKLGPFVPKWDIKAYKDIQEIRKTENDYFGYWNKKTNKKEGYGQQLYPDGSKYSGLWSKGIYQGQGRLISADGKYYAGNWREGKPDGIGTLGSIDGVIYKGDWEKGTQHGYGIEYWPDGSRYEGIFINGKKEGKATFIFADKTKYYGLFKDNMIAGQGI